MPRRQHTSEEFGKPISSMTGVHPMDSGAHSYGAASQILINAIVEKESGRTPSSFSIPGWKIALALVLALLLGIGGAYYVTHSDLRYRAYRAAGYS